MTEGTIRQEWIEREIRRLIYSNVPRRRWTGQELRRALQRRWSTVGEEAVDRAVVSLWKAGAMKRDGDTHWIATA